MGKTKKKPKQGKARVCVHVVAVTGEPGREQNMQTSFVYEFDQHEYYNANVLDRRLSPYPSPAHAAVDAIEMALDDGDGLTIALTGAGVTKEKF